MPERILMNLQFRCAGLVHRFACDNGLRSKCGIGKLGKRESNHKPQCEARSLAKSCNCWQFSSGVREPFRYAGGGSPLAGDNRSQRPSYCMISSAMSARPPSVWP